MNETKDALPELHQAVLDHHTLLELFHDLEQLTRVFHVTGKTARRSDTLPSNLSFANARELFLSEELRAVQIRYVYQGEEWWDTLIQSEDGVRLTRIRQTNSEEKLE